MSHKILVVDDEPQIRELLRRFLTKSGYEVTTVESGAEAIKKITDKSFSLVLSDVMMPGMDGLETLSRIKKIDGLLPVIMMSGFGTHDRVIKSLEKGAADFIAKPINFTQAKQIIRKTLVPKNEEFSSPLNHLLKEGYLNLLKLMIRILETKDPYIKGHGTRVAGCAVKIAQAIKLPEGTVEVINYAGIIHDIGKSGVSDVILSKPSELNENEWTDIKMHSTIGSILISQLKLFRPEEPLVKHHHEYYDGSGYPDGLRGEEIPIGARILTVADAYDAMTSSRPYRKAMDIKKASKIISDNSGKQFDPKIAEVFLNTI